MGLFDKIKNAAVGAVDNAKKTLDNVKAANEEKLRIDEAICGNVMWGVHGGCVFELVEDTKMILYKPKKETYAGGHVTRDVYEKMGEIDFVNDVHFFWFEYITPDSSAENISGYMTQMKKREIVFYMKSEDYMPVSLKEKAVVPFVTALLTHGTKMDEMTLKYGNLLLRKHGGTPIEREVNFDLTDAIPEEYYRQALAILEERRKAQERADAARAAAEQRLAEVRASGGSSDSSSGKMSVIERDDNRRKRIKMCGNCANKGGCPDHKRFDWSSPDCVNFRSNK